MSDPAEVTPPQFHLETAEYILDSIPAAQKDGSHAIAHALLAVAYSLKRLVDEDLDINPPTIAPPPPQSEPEPTVQAYVFTHLVDGQAMWVGYDEERRAFFPTPVARQAYVYGGTMLSTTLKHIENATPGRRIEQKTVFVRGDGSWRLDGVGSWVMPGALPEEEPTTMGAYQFLESTATWPELAREYRDANRVAPSLADPEPSEEKLALDERWEQS